MDPITDQDLPIEDLIENEDGSVDIIEVGEESTESDFQDNLALTLDATFLKGLATDLLEDIDRDKQARTKRDKQYEDGLRRTGMGDDAPGGAEFEGASDVVHPVLAEACVEFNARAIKELFPPQGPVKTATIGGMTDEQLDRAERKRTFLNWQLTTQMQEYRSELEQLLTQLPLGGSQFQKFWYDARFNRPTSEFVPIDDILIPYAATSFYTAQRVTHVQHVTQQEFEKRVRSGLYRDVALSAVGSTPEQSASATANDKIEGKEEDAYNEDGLRNIFEVYLWADVGDERAGDDPAPYIITVDEYSEEVLAIYRNWAADDQTFEKLDWLVEWKFIPWRGAYAIGFPQLIGSLSAAATGSLRALLDAAHINNLPGLIKLKGNGTNGQNIQVNATGVSELDAPAGVDDIRKLLMPMPFNPPSPILFQLLGWLTEAAKGVVRTAEDAIQNAGDRTPVGTTQAMIEQGSTIYSAIHARLHESQKRALKILCRINATWLNDEEEVEDLGKLIIRRDDFKGSLDIIPVSDPAIFSEAQRYAQNQSLNQMQMQDAQDPSIPWNKIALRRRMLKQMRIDNIDEVLPLPPKPITADPLTESIAIIAGKQVVAVPQQDHLAHLNGHLLHLSNPLVVQNPLLQGNQLMPILLHAQQHLTLLEQQMIQAVAQKLMADGVQLQGDELIAKAIELSAKDFTAMVQPVFARIAELLPQVQAKMPPPPMPPEIQASIQIAKMETDRKAQLDKATIEFKNAEAASKQQLEAAQFKLDQMQQLFDQALEKQRLLLTEQNDRLTAQVDLMNNKADNQQKQMTDLLKNRDDNETKMQIEMQKGFEQLRAQLSQPQQVTQPQVDLTPHIEKMQGLLDQIGQTKTNDALTAVVQGLQATIQTLNQPRRTTLEHDAQGNPIGAVSTLSE